MPPDRKVRVVPEARQRQVYAQEARRGYEAVKVEPVPGRVRRTWRVTFQRKQRAPPAPPPPPMSTGWVTRTFTARTEAPEPEAPGPGVVSSREYALIGQRQGLSGYDLSRFTRVLRVRRPEGMPRDAVEEWARLFRDHQEWDRLTPEGREVLLETDGIAIARGGAGPIAHAHTHHYYTPEQVQRILARGQTPIVHHGGPCGPECARGHVTHVHRRGKSHQPRS